MTTRVLCLDELHRRDTVFWPLLVKKEFPVSF